MEGQNIHFNFAYRQHKHVPVTINNTRIRNNTIIRYIELNFDMELQWTKHIKKKRNELDFKYKKIYWQLKRRPQLLIHTYESQLWGCEIKSLIHENQVFQKKVPRSPMVWLLHRDLKNLTVKEEIKQICSEVGKTPHPCERRGTTTSGHHRFKKKT